MCEKYNGWGDRATWIGAMMVAGNYGGEGDAAYWESYVDDAGRMADDQDAHIDAVEAGLVEWWDEATANLEMGLFFSDLLASPDWREIAVSLVTDWRNEGGNYGDDEKTEE